MSMTKINSDWENLQCKVFARWATNALKPFNLVINELTTDFTDGVNLIKLAEVLTQKEPFRKFDQKPRIPVQKTQNCDLAIEMFLKDGVKFVGIGGKDIVDANLKLTLGLIWHLILKYTIAEVEESVEEEKKEEKGPAKPKKSATQVLMAWALDNTEEYPGIEKFRPLPLAMCALLNNYDPEKINFAALDPSNHEFNAKLAMRTCENLNIPLLLDWEDLVHGIDEKSLNTQLSLMRKELKHRQRLIEKGAPIDVIPVPAAPAPDPIPAMPTDIEKVLINWANMKGVPQAEFNNISQIKGELPKLAAILTNNEGNPIELLSKDGAKVTEESLENPESLLLSLVVKYSANPESSDYTESDEIQKFNVSKPPIFAMANLIKSYIPDAFQLHEGDAQKSAEDVETFCKANGLPLLLDREQELSLDIDDRAVFVELAALKDELEKKKKQKEEAAAAAAANAKELEEKRIKDELDDKVFSKWATYLLQDKGIKFDRITAETLDSEKLSNLIEALCGTKPKENTTKSLLELLHSNVQGFTDTTTEAQLLSPSSTAPTNYSPEDVKSKLEFLWNLIVRYNFSCTVNPQDPKKVPKTQAPINFFQKCQEESGVKGLKPLAFSMLSLISKYFPGSVNIKQFEGAPEEAVLNELFKVCEEINAPILVEREDFSRASGRTTLTQFYVLRQYLINRKRIMDEESRVFSRWASFRLKERNVVINNASEQIAEGQNLGNLVEVLSQKGTSGKTIPSSIEVLKSDGFDSNNVNVAANHFEGNLSFFWNLIGRYELNPIVLPPQADARSVVPIKKTEEDFGKWCEVEFGANNGLPLEYSMAVLVNKYFPEKIADISSIDKKDKKKTLQTLLPACQSLGAPILLIGDEFYDETITSRVVYTQLSVLKTYLETLRKKLDAEEDEKKRLLLEQEERERIEREERERREREERERIERERKAAEAARLAAESRVYSRWASLKLNERNIEISNAVDEFSDGYKLVELTNVLCRKERVATPNAANQNIEMATANLRDDFFVGDIASSQQIGEKQPIPILNLLNLLVIRYSMLDAVESTKQETNSEENDYAPDQTSKEFLDLIKTETGNQATEDDFVLSRAVITLLAKYFPDTVNNVDPNKAERASIDFCQQLALPLLLHTEEEFTDPNLSPRAKIAVLAALREAILKKKQEEEIVERDAVIDLEQEDDSHKPLPTETIESPILHEADQLKQNLIDERLDRNPDDKKCNSLWVVVPLVIVAIALPVLSNLL